MTGTALTEAARIADQLKFAFEGPAWSGPSVMETLSGVSATAAARRPPGGVHTIWELVHHIAAWEGIALRRLGGDPATNITPQEDYPPVTDTSEDAWARTLSRLKEGHLALRKAILAFSDEQLSTTVPGHDYTYYVLFHGAAQHDLYHAGQIAILKRIATHSATATRP